jgi:hypothetical protein
MGCGVLGDFAFDFHEGAGTARADAAADAGSHDARIDAPESSDCLGKPFGAPAAVKGLPDLGETCAATFTADELTIIVPLRADDSSSRTVLFTAKRANRTDPFDPLTPLALDPPIGADPPDPPPRYETPSLSVDSTTLALAFFGPNSSDFDIASSIRSTTDGPFPRLVRVGPPNTSRSERWPFLTDELWFVREDGSGGAQIFSSAIQGGDLQPPILHDELDQSGKTSVAPVVTLVGRVIYFASTPKQASLVPRGSVRSAHRASIGESFAPSSVVGELAAFEAAPAWISRDECRLYLCISGEQGAVGLFVSERGQP